MKYLGDFHYTIFVFISNIIWIGMTDALQYIIHVLTGDLKDKWG
jgi:hypothetical protein